MAKNGKGGEEMSLSMNDTKPTAYLSNSISVRLGVGGLRRCLLLFFFPCSFM